MTRLSMVMIARDEEENVEPCFETFWDHVDEVVLCDTGSVDGTVAVARAFAEARGESTKLISGHFEWCDDFAAARNYADSLATGDWLLWSDLDDRVVGGEHLRALADAAPDRCLMALFEWHSEVGDAATTVARMVRKGPASRWFNKCAEARILPRGRCMLVSPSIAFWRHPPWLKINDPYYRRLWEEMLVDDPCDEFALAYLGFGRVVAGEHASAVEFIRRYLDVGSPTAEFRQSLAFLMVQSLLALDRGDEASAVAANAYDEDPAAPEACLSLATVSSARSDWRGAIRWADDTLRLGPRPTRRWQIVAPSAFTWLPLSIKGRSLAFLGEVDEAIRVCSEASECCPENMAEAQATFLSALQDHATHRARGWRESGFGVTPTVLLGPELMSGARA